MTASVTVHMGADHGGFADKETLKQWLKEQGYTVVDHGNTEHDPDDDYPAFARTVAEAVAEDPEANRGILLCRTGEGMDIVANKIKGVRATVGFSEELARKSREHNDANVLTLASDYQDTDAMKRILNVWLTAEFPEEGGERHVRRVQQIEAIEEETMK